jgi:hypothetical protein
VWTARLDADARALPGKGRHSSEHRAQAFGASTPDVHLAQEQIGEHAHERKDAHDDHPRDSRRRVPVGPKKDSPDDGQLQQHHEGDADDRVAEQVDH